MNDGIPVSSQASEFTEELPVPVKPLSLSLSSVTVKDKARLTVWAEYKDGISFQICYVSKGELTSLARKCMSLVWGDGNKSRQPKLNTEEFAKRFAKIAVKDWKGATFNSLSSLLVLDPALVNAEDRDKEIAFTYENLAACIEASNSLDEFLQAAVTDPLTFAPEKEEEEKN